MFDIGWTELLVIGVVALIVVGPKDLPGMFRTLGKFTGKAKAMARDFQRAMDQAADEVGVKDVAEDLKSATSSRNLGLDSIEAAASKFEKWDPDLTPAKGPETAKLTAERAEAKRKIHEATAKKAQARLDEAAAEEKAAKDAMDRLVEEKKAAEKADKPAAKTSKGAEKKPAAKKAAAKKPAAKKPAAKKPAAKKAATKKPTAKKPAAKKAAPKKTTPKKPAEDA